MYKAIHFRRSELPNTMISIEYTILARPQTDDSPPGLLHFHSVPITVPLDFPFHAPTTNPTAERTRRLYLETGRLTLDAADDDAGCVLGDDLVVVQHFEFCFVSAQESPTKQTSITMTNCNTSKQQKAMTHPPSRPSPYGRTAPAAHRDARPASS